MELNITHMMEDDMGLLSGSVFELGENAGKITWDNSLAYGEEHPLLTDDQIQEAKDYFKSYGAWDDKEIAAWSDNEVQALVVQEVASNIREMEMFDTYDEYMTASEKGTASGRIYRNDDGRFFFYLGM